MKLVAIGKVRLSNKIVIAGGELFECKAKLGEMLLKNGAALVADAKAEVVPNLEAIASAIGQLMADDPDKANELVWKKDGSPRVDAVRKRLDFDATADEINAAVEAMKPDGGSDDE